MIFFIILPVKKYTNRDRPANQTNLHRLKDLRSREKDYSMPSGDSASCSYQCIYYWIIFQNPSVMFIILPLCQLGRVYAMCHWFGDTMVGAVIGVICSRISIQYMHILGYHLFSGIMNISPTMSIAISFITMILILVKENIITCKRKNDNFISFSIEKANNLK